MAKSNDLYDVKIRVRSSVKLIGEIKDLLERNPNRERLFRITVFDPWLDILSHDNDNHLMHYVLQHQVIMKQKLEIMIDFIEGGDTFLDSKGERGALVKFDDARIAKLERLLNDNFMFRNDSPNGNHNAVNQGLSGSANHPMADGKNDSLNGNQNGVSKGLSCLANDPLSTCSGPDILDGEVADALIGIHTADGKNDSPNVNHNAVNKGLSCSANDLMSTCSSPDIDNGEVVVADASMGISKADGQNDIPNANHNAVNQGIYGSANDLMELTRKMGIMTILILNEPSTLDVLVQGFDSQKNHPGIDSIPNYSLDDMKLQDEEEKLISTPAPVNHQEVDELVDVHKDKTTMLQENLKTDAEVGANVGISLRQYAESERLGIKMENLGMGKCLQQQRAEGNALGNNGNQIRSRIQLQAEEFDLMAAAADLDEIEEVNANCILMANLQQASTSDSSNLQTELDRTKERFENCIIKKENEYAKLWNEWYKKCEECKYDKFHNLKMRNVRIRVQVRNKKKKLLTVTTLAKTRRPHPRSTTKNEKVIQICLGASTQVASKHMTGNLKLSQFRRKPFNKTFTPSILQEKPLFPQFSSMARASSTNHGYGINFIPTSKLTQSMTLPKRSCHQTSKNHISQRNITLSSGEQGKSKKRRSPPTQTSFQILSGRLPPSSYGFVCPMRIASINGKAIYFGDIMWTITLVHLVHFLSSKDEAPEVIKPPESNYCPSHHLSSS
ncbi:hypothetical protein Tco_0923084 [Tanacetum coccineum]|uniref:Uncharacterized protein n=1 Tax=Tanacetum coccineum TaxID=301880 RepID=A0ABQ5D198_9ASTR